MSAINIFLSLLPVITFLAVLMILDSFKLIKAKLIITCLIWGAFCVGVAYLLNRWLIFSTDMPNIHFNLKLVPPIIEEVFKISLIIFLVKYNRIGFMIDGAIYGFAIGTGFALIENIYFLLSIHSDGSLLWLVRGFGTAIMHGGTVAIFSVILLSGTKRGKNIVLRIFIGLVIAILIHYLYNFLSGSARVATLSIMILIPTFLFLVFSINERSIRKWVDLEMDKEVELLLAIRKGRFMKTNAGRYIVSLKEHFAPLIMADIMSYIYIYLELSTKAKANLILKENNMPALRIPDIKEQLAELSQLKKNIGKTGLIALRPILRMNKKDLWQLTTLK